MEINTLNFINTGNHQLLTARNSMAPQENFMELLERAKNATESKNTNEIDKNDKLYQLCLELETFIVKNMLSTMRNTIQKSGLIEEGFAGKMYEDMLYDEYAKNLTQNAGFGLAEQAYRQLTQ